MGEAVGKGKQAEKEWNALAAAYKKKYPDSYKLFNQYLAQELPKGWMKKYRFMRLRKAPRPRALFRLM